MNHSSNPGSHPCIGPAPTLIKSTQQKTTVNNPARSRKYLLLTMILLCAAYSLTQAQSVFKVSGGNCVGDNMVFAFGGPTCTVNWIIQTGVSYTIVNSSNTQLTIRFNQPVGTPVVVITANYFSCSNGQSGGANSSPFGVNGVSSAGSISGNQTICYGGDPAAFTSSVNASGVGHSYQWQQSTNGGATWSTISGATSSTYNPPSGLTVTTQYRRRAVGCNQTLNSNVVTVTVRPDLNPGSISGNQNICLGDDPSTISNSASASGGNGSYAYQWQQSTNGGSSWTNISGATSTSYNPPVPTTTTMYRRRVISCGQTKYSNTVTVTVASISVPSGLTENGIQYNAFNAVWNSSTCATYYEVMISRDNTWGNGNDCGPFTNNDTDYSFQSAYWNTDCSESLQDGERYYWRVRACNGGFCSSWSTDFVDLPSAGRMGASELSDAKITPTIYPNPVSGHVIKVTGTGSPEPIVIRYRILDPTGLMMKGGSFQSDEGLDVSNLPSGAYILQYDVAGMKKVERVYKE